MGCDRISSWIRPDHSKKQSHFDRAASLAAGPFRQNEPNFSEVRRMRAERFFGVTKKQTHFVGKPSSVSNGEHTTDL